MKTGKKYFHVSKLYLPDNQVYISQKCFVVPEYDLYIRIFICMFAACLSNQYPKGIKTPVSSTIIIGCA